MNTAILELLEEALVSFPRVQQAKPGVDRVEMPFLDWKGAPSFFYVDAGKVTDGGAVLNEIRALGLDQAYIEWKFRTDFLAHYGILEEHGRLICADPKDGAVLLSYAQGISRIISYFDVKAPVLDNHEFLREVKKTTKPQIVKLLEGFSPSRRDELADLHMARREVPIGNYTQKIDLTPTIESVWPQVVGAERADSTRQAEHVNSKLMPHFLAKEEEIPHVLVIVVPELAAYPSTVIKIIKDKADDYIELRKDGGPEKLAELLVKRTP